ncbi:hypothetical protein B9J81_00465 [Vibrio sp. V04_P4A5T148]|nr:hypothetical protein B9J95_14260 [Vibrio sp. V14_P6S14T42]OXX39044.1 hypothetical protein B9J81_00465 [Vibrio sp. V04_P4A5T148]
MTVNTYTLHFTRTVGGNLLLIMVVRFVILSIGTRLNLHSRQAHNKQFKQIRNAWQFWFAVSFVFRAQCVCLCIALLTT